MGDVAAYNGRVMNGGTEESRSARAAARRTWAVRLARLQDAGRDDLSAVTSPEERIAMVWALTVDAWALAGLPMPDYERADAPVRVVRP